MKRKLLNGGLLTDSDLVFRFNLVHCHHGGDHGVRQAGMALEK